MVLSDLVPNKFIDRLVKGKAIVVKSAKACHLIGSMFEYSSIGVFQFAAFLHVRAASVRKQNP
jgi:hypothetical protein